MKNMINRLSVFILLAVLTSFAQIPERMSYQGILTDPDGTVVPDGSYSLEFNLYATASGGTSLWTETQDVSIANGLFYVILGSIHPLDLSFDQPCYLGITVEEGTELAPRIELTAAAYSLTARSVADSSISGAGLQNGQVVRSVNSLKDDVFLKAGDRVTISQEQDSLVISAIGDGGSPWSQNGNDLYYLMGNIGIGAVTVSYPLTMFPATHSRGISLTHYHDLPQETSSINVRLNKSAADNTAAYGMFNQTTNDAGTGSAFGAYGLANGNSSGAKYGLRGYAQGAGTHYGVYGHADGEGTQYGVWGSASGTGTLWAGYFSGNVYAEAIRTGGTVGIGTSAPREALEVNGMIYSSLGGFRFPDGSVQTSASGSGSGNGNTLDQAYDQGGPGAGREIMADTGPVEIHGLGGLVVDDMIHTGGLLLRGLEGVEGGQVTILDEDTEGAWEIDSYGETGTEALRIFRDRGYNDVFSLILQNSGSIGVGTPYPLARLHVMDGEISLPSEALLNEVVIVEDSDAGLGLYSTETGNYGSFLSMGEISSGSLSNKWTLYRTTSTASPANELRFAFGSNAEYNLNPAVMSIDPAGRLGIGTTSPGAGIHLRGDQYPNSFLFLEAGDTFDAGIRLYEGSVPQWHIFNNALFDGFQIYNSNGANTVFFADQSTGNVGIGTTSPSQKLQVAGTICSTIGGFMFPDGSVQTTAALFGQQDGVITNEYKEEITKLSDLIESLRSEIDALKEKINHLEQAR